MRATALAATFALVAALGGVPAAVAHPLPHGDVPRVVDVEPAPGSVVPADELGIRALAAAGQPVTAHRVRVDGDEVAGQATQGDHATVSAQVRLEPGPHRVEVSATSEAGQGGRAWEFTVSPLRVSRLAGADRVGTAVAISQDLYRTDGSANAAVLARMDDFPDALAGVPLAHAVGGPLLLSRSSELSAATAEELRRILPPGATVYLLGGPGALATRVEAEVAALGLVPERLAGRTRYETAVEIAKLLPDADHAVLVSGEDFADALAAGSPAARNGWPILLARAGSLPDEVRAHLAWARPEGVYLVGGTAALAPGVQDAVAGLVRGVSRTAGSTRFETAAAVGQRFLPDAEVVGLANGASFADALAGGVHAATHGAPLLLSSRSRVFNPQLVQIGAAGPQRAFAFGGPAALQTSALYDLLRGVVDAGGPLLDGVTPTGTVTDLGEVVVTFDRAVDPSASTVYLTVGDHEVAGELSGTASGRGLRFVPAEVPPLEAGRTYPVRAVVSASDGATTRHLEHAYAYRTRLPELRPGDAGPEVADLQRRLRDAGYWVGPADGRYGSLTQQAVLALKKVHGLARDGVYDEAARQVLESRPPRPRARTTRGLYYEVDLERQVLMRVVDGQVTWIFNTSTGHGQWYWFQGSRYRATTTTGDHAIVFQRDYPHEAARGLLWRPKYYDLGRGIAIHGSASVPAHPASAGCIRVTNAAMDFIWSLDPNPTGRVLVHPANYYR